MKTYSRYSCILLTVVGLVFYYFSWNQTSDSGHGKPADDFAPRTHPLFDTVRLRTPEPGVQSSESISNQSCTMHTCFNFTRCAYSAKVYVYPDVDGLKPSETYSKILQSIRKSSLYTDNPMAACLYVLSLDTIDRDRRSENYVQSMQSYIDHLPAEVWNNGMNHVIFNLYHGTFPDYSDHDLGFDIGKAIVARASASEKHFRHGFDLSLPLFHKEHPLKEMVERTFVDSRRSQYLVSFKGKRYVYGIGSETRDSLHHLHDGKSIAMLTTCKHNNDWQMHQDERCDRDNGEYERWDYEELMLNSTFCLTPRGRRLGSFRFLESLSTGCIPVVLSDEWVLPFSEFIDWKRAAVRISEKNVLLSPDILYSFPRRRIEKMRSNARRIYREVFGTVEKIAMTGLQIVLDRLSHPSHLFVSPPLILSPLDGRVTVIVLTGEDTRLLQNCLDLLNSMPAIVDIVIISSRGATVLDSVDSRIKPRFVNSAESLSSLSVSSPCLLFLDDRMRVTKAEVENLLRVHEKYPQAMVSSHVTEYKVGQDRTQQIALPTLAAVHSAYLTTPSHPTTLSHSCLWLSLHLSITHASWLPPVTVGDRLIEDWMIDGSLDECWRTIADYWPKGLPLLPAGTRYAL